MTINHNAVQRSSMESPPEQFSSLAISREMVDKLREDVIKHFEGLNLPALNGSSSNGKMTKDAIRKSQAYRRNEIARHEYETLKPYFHKLIPSLASSEEVVPSKIDPELIPVNSHKFTGLLFRFACLFWGVPVSKGFGRRIRFLVKDRSNDKLIGIFALGDPVFNLKCRDEMIGWTGIDRRERLVNVMDAYVVGAVPPYNQLLGGKMVASLMCSQEVNTYFSERYKDAIGIISKKQKSPRLVLITLTSALGRSSLYNRLKLVKEGILLLNFKKIGETSGYGHFHFSSELFDRLRALLDIEGHSYASGYKFGDGLNWRMRVIKVGLSRLGLDDELVHHGIHREVYVSPLAKNFKEYLRGEVDQPNLNLHSAQEISRAAIERWVLPRALTNDEWRRFCTGNIMNLIPKFDEE